MASERLVGRLKIEIAAALRKMKAGDDGAVRKMAAKGCREVIVNDKLASGALLRVPLIIFCQHGRPTPTR
jgi:hypothetical protein